MKKSKKERKFTKLTIKIGDKTFYRSVSYRTLSELTEKRQKIEEELRRENSDKFSDIADRWQEEHDEEVKGYTKSCYVAPLKDLKAEFGKKPVNEIGSIEFQMFLDKMKKQGFAKQTIRLRKIVMKMVLDYALAHKMIIYNPISVCKVPKNSKKSTRTPPSDTDVELIKSHPEGTFGLYCNFLLYTGLRREEALALSFDDIDFEKKTIRISKVVVFEGSKPIVRDSTKTEAGERYVPLLEPVEKLLSAVPEKQGLLFSGKYGIMTKYEFDKGFRKYKDSTGISCTSHQLRHYFATLCFDAELKEKDVQEIMGHSKISLTHDVYTHIRKQRKEQSTEKLNAFLLAKEKENSEVSA